MECFGGIILDCSVVILCPGFILWLVFDTAFLISLSLETSSGRLRRKPTTLLVNWYQTSGNPFKSSCPCQRDGKLGLECTNVVWNLLTSCDYPCWCSFWKFPKYLEVQQSPEHTPGCMFLFNPWMKKSISLWLSLYPNCDWIPQILCYHLGCFCYGTKTVHYGLPQTREGGTLNMWRNGSRSRQLVSQSVLI